MLHSLLADRDFAGLEHFDRSLALPDGFDQAKLRGLTYGLQFPQFCLAIPPYPLLTRELCHL